MDSLDLSLGIIKLNNGQVSLSNPTTDKVDKKQKNETDSVKHEQFETTSRSHNKSRNRKSNEYFSFSNLEKEDPES